MLNQQEIFRNQVLELHRLYEIQKILMKNDFRLSSGESPHSFVGPFSENLKYESLATETKLSKVHTICSLGSLQNHCLKEHRGTLQHQRISLDLNLAVTQNTNGNLLGDCINPEVSALTEKSRKACDDKFFCSPSLQSIHLEGSPYGRDHIPILARRYATYSGAENDFEASCSFKCRKNNSFDWIPEFQSLRNGRPNLLGRNFFYQVEQCHEDLLCKNMFARRKPCTSSEVEELDLYKALLNGSSAHRCDPWIFNPSKCTSSGVSYDEVGEYGKVNIITVLEPRQPNNNHLTESSALTPQDIAVSPLILSPSKDTSEHFCKTTVCSVDFDSVCGPLFDSKGRLQDSRDFRPKIAESEIRLPGNTCWRLSKKKKDNFCSHYSNQEILEGTDSNSSPASSKYESSLVAKKLVLQNVMPSSEMRSDQSCNPEREELTEADSTVKNGTACLLYLSSQCSAGTQDYNCEPRKRKESCNVEKEAPQTSSESYESIVLKQQECIIDEYCISSTPFEVTGLDKNDHGVKLKRGRRMKDFRKEILPGLGSLSRKEISEDIKIMEVALRSREYKKCRSRIVTKSDSITPVRSRRSRLRNYS